MPKYATYWQHPEHPLILYQPDSKRGRAKYYYRISLPGQPRVEGLLAKEFAYSDRHYERMSKEWEFTTTQSYSRPPADVIEYGVRLLFRLREQVGRGKDLQPVRVPTMQKAAEQYCDSLDAKLERGEITKEQHKHHAGFARRYIVPYREFARLTVSEVNEDHLHHWQLWRDQYWTHGPGKAITDIPYERGGQKLTRRVNDADRRPPTASTKNKEKVYLTAIFHFAVEKKWMQRSEIPKHDFTNTQMSPANKRPAFTRDQWERLKAFAEKEWLAPPKLSGDNRRMRQLCWWFCVLLRAYGLRPAEGYTLKFSNIYEETLEDGEVTVVIHVPWVKSEGHERQVEPIFRFTSEVRRILRDLPAFYEREYSIKPQATDPLFMHADRTPIKSFYRGFESLLAEAKMETDAEGNSYSLTSLRHAAITEEIETTTLNPSIVADWAGTSVKMLQEHYSQPLTRRVRRAEREGRRR